jgi:hypothetical protein
MTINQMFHQRHKVTALFRPSVVAKILIETGNHEFTARGICLLF